MSKFKSGDLCVIRSETSHNNGRVAEVIAYTKGKYDDILRVQIRSQIINIREDSLRPASKFDIIRNLSDKQLKRLLNSLKRKEHMSGN